ncbi:unnamed protein product [Cochlearia groenlandica]
MRATLSLLTFNQKIMLRCKKLMIKITRSCPGHHYRHLKLRKASSSSSSSRKGTRVLATFFKSFQKKKKQKNEKIKRLNEHMSFSDSISEKKTSNPESKKKVFPSSLTPTCLGQGKARWQRVTQDQDAPRDSTSTFFP